ncbi:MULTISPECIES: nickel/cobalt ABC transporter permease [Bacillus]|jgi:nickel transport system permease protein|uniref:nickel/cobalt ABC transporter permease n=1 Tax=Bacillus TaxID=1386 RepID=UPI000A95BE1F|nr:nickel/cobalt ABC transporter permease [Bacillus altitudinis]MCY7452273.1 ABC transporter permease subunit [Bacillus altitudinis]MED0849192.1 ABC transporter permease subunit [Bacillus altitudinis]MEE3604069.1 nickel/cobalt ABC transporter permease [Bacillus altitudinis]MEE3610403.1 nickel/cobalt ABC transporter permease [Bacillus altitudinis]MEE3645808.1 nickel/cobalt ABC transporter permease [Bacillus altitudinis]
MTRYIIKRLLFLLPLIVFITFFAFVLLAMRSSDPAEVALRVNQVTPTEEMVESMRQELGLDQPFFLRYVTWLKDGLTGDFGNSYVTREPVLDLILEALPATLQLAGMSLLFIIVLSLLFGMVCAYAAHTWLDRIVRAFVFIAASMPSFWLGILFIWLFSVKFNWVNTSGMEGFKSILLPAMTLSLGYLSTYVRLIRNQILKFQHEPFVFYARARGLKERTIQLKVMRHALQLAVTALGMSIPKLIAGTVIIENLFAWPGVGRLCVTAIFHADFPIIQAYLFVMGCLFVVCNLVADVIQMIMNPQLRKEV